MFQISLSFVWTYYKIHDDKRLIVFVDIFEA